MSRVASAIVLIALLAGTIWATPWWGTLVLAAIAAMIAGGEVASLARHVGAPISTLFAGVAAAIVTVAFGLHDAGTGTLAREALPIVLLAVVMAAGLLALTMGAPSPASVTAAGALVLAPMYVGLPLGAASWIRTAAGPEPLTWLVAVIAISDSAQYYTGRNFGRRKLAPLVSPAKTIEGALGGVVAAAAAGAAIGVYWLPGLSPLVCGALGAVLAVVGMCGDLFESMLKRGAGVKDSSNLIPGHGGILDRIDAYLFAAPAFYLFLRYLA